MEINALVELYNKPIIVAIQDNNHFNIIMIYDNINNNKINYNIDEVVFLLFVNGEGCDLLIPEKRTIFEILLEEIDDIDLIEKIKLLKINNETCAIEVDNKKII